MSNSMIHYYESKMNNSYRQWQVALQTDKPIAAKMHKEDYENYKDMYERRMKACGESA